MDLIEGFQNLADYINDQQGVWIINDTCPVHLPINVEFIIIFRDTTWVWSPSTQGECIGVMTQAMICSPHGPLQIGQILLARRSIQFPFNHSRKTTFHAISEYESDNFDTFARNGFAAHSWGLLSKNDIHYRLLRIKENNLVADIISEAFEHCNDGDMVIFTNLDICLVPEASAILWAYMINRDLSVCYNSRVDTETQIPYVAKDIENEIQYCGIDTFVFIKNSQSQDFLKRASEYKLQIGRMGWDSAWVELIDGLTGFARCPYNISYHVKHESFWKYFPEENENNIREISRLFQDKHLAINDQGRVFYKPIPWIF
jgi:hypothetical protein